MQKLIFLISGCLLSIFSYSARSVPKDHRKPEQVNTAIPASYPHICVIKFIQLKPREYKKVTGKKLSLKESLALQLGQIKIKRGLRKEHFVALCPHEKGPRKKPKLLVALLIVLGITLLVFGIFITIGSLAFS